MRVLTVFLAALAATHLSAQQPPAAAAPAAKAIAPVDLTGYWVSVISEDWQWRMVTPAKGDYASLPLNAAGRAVADRWNPADDGSCRAYGAAAVMRLPLRVHITWETDNTLRIDTDAGRQTRRLRFDAAPPAPRFRDAQGHSVARWELTGQAASSGAARWASLKVVTTNMRAGWLRKNGVPYSENAAMTEYFDRFTDGASEWFTVTTIVDDPTYLTQPLVISSNFKRELDGSNWNPVACRA